MSFVNSLSCLVPNRRLLNVTKGSSDKKNQSDDITGGLLFHLMTEKRAQWSVGIKWIQK